MLNLEDVRIKTKCDFTGCRNIASISFCDTDDKKKKINLCDECVRSIYCTYAKSIVPKSIEAPFKTRKLTKK